MILEDLYRGKYEPTVSITVHHDRDKLTQLLEEILAALPEEKKELVDAAQDAFMEMVILNRILHHLAPSLFFDRVIIKTQGLYSCQEKNINLIFIFRY